LPFCVPAGIFTFAFPPSIVGTSTVAPSAAPANEMGNLFKVMFAKKKGKKFSLGFE